MKKIALAIHGGAGTILKSSMTPALENKYRKSLQTALEIGWEILKNGGNSLDSVEATVVSLENAPLFNAGKGAVFTHDEKNEMDAAIMDGKNLNAGAIAFVRNVKNPIKLARLVMEKTEHILLAGIGAGEFAKQMRVEFEPDEYFFTDFRYEQFLSARAKGIVELDHAPDENESLKSQVSSLKSQTKSLSNPKSKIQNPKSKIGTVGAAACDFWETLRRRLQRAE
ncbi:MAG: isoaspartyl peptidase/L-asparaginase [Pyrinomonadaceae bacterium]